MSADPNRLSLTGKRWHWPVAALQHEISGSTGLPAWVDALLSRRGIVGDEALRRHLSPTLASLEDPSCMTDVGTALRTLVAALRAQQPIVVYGDYDVDGVCSTALLVEFLRGLGGNVDYYIPERRSEGYGLNEKAIRDIAARAKLLITTDCGITAHHEVAIARELGCEVIVVDHHRVGETLPPATACLDPHRDDCGFAGKVLCATGVAFMLVVALRRAWRDAAFFAGKPEPDVRLLLDLVALATVADMVPLTGINRVLVAAGLKQLANTGRIGLRALIDVAGIAGPAITTSDIGFRLGPRLNARGRLNHAGVAVELMLTRDAAGARQIALSLDAANRERRDLEKTTLQAAMAVVASNGLDADAALCVYDETWHAGVLGLVASRLASTYHRPAIVIGEGGKGSGRSIPGLDLHAILSLTASHLSRFGGHAAAAGVTIEPARIDDFRRALADAVHARLGQPPYVAVVEPDIETPVDAMSLPLLATIEGLAPFGQHNPEPLWASADVAVQSMRVVGGDHVKLVVGDAGHEAMGFGMASAARDLPRRLDIVYHLERNTYGGHDKLMLRIKDLRPAAGHSS